MTLGPPTPAGSSLPGRVQTLTLSSEPQQTGMYSGHKGCALLDSGPQVLDAPSPQSGGLLCPLSAAGDMEASGRGSREAGRAQDPPPKPCGHPSWLAMGGRRRGTLAVVCLHS